MYIPYEESGEESGNLHKMWKEKGRMKIWYVVKNETGCGKGFI